MQYLKSITEFITVHLNLLVAYLWQHFNKKKKFCETKRTKFLLQHNKALDRIRFK